VEPRSEDNPLPPPQPPEEPPRQALEPGPTLSPSAAAMRSEGRFDARESRPTPVGDSRPIPATTVDGGLATTAPEIDPSTAPSAAPQFGVYQLLEKIGQGGMGTIYKARHLIFGRVEALKMISAERLGSPGARSRFRDEMQALAQLEHPNIVKVYTADEVAGELYFSMAYEGGGDLAKLVKEQGAQKPERAADLVRQVAEAVEYAHQKHIIHLDLKPHNVLLSAEGTPKVTDFGLALWLARAGADRPASGEAVGTPSYMPPEQVRGEFDKVQAWSDVYGLGAILYELLTGRPPFLGKSLRDTLRLVTEERPTPPRAYQPAIPQRLEAICLKCLEKDPAKRYVTAGELAEALRRFLEPPWWKRHWRTAAVAAVVGVLGVALLRAGWEGYQEPRREADRWVLLAEKARDEGDHKNAIHYYTDAVPRYEELLNSSLPRWNRAGLRLALARVQTRLGELQEEARDPVAAEAALRAAEATLEGLRKAAPANPEYTLQLAEVHHLLGSHFSTQNKWTEAKDHFAQGLRLREELRGSQWRTEGYRSDLARSYGYLGDVQILLGEAAEGLDSYRKAEQLRAELAEENPDDPKALCLHARDFGNMGSYYDRMGDPQKALDSYRQRVRYYQENADALGPRLPGAFETERIDAAVAVAELELDQADRVPATVPQLLGQAAAEYRLLLNGEAEDKAPPGLVAGLAELHLLWGKYYCRQDQAEKAREELRAAKALYQSLEDAKKAQSDDYYYWAAAYALQSELVAANPEQRISAQTRAVDRLRKAVKEGYNHRKQLERDRSFSALRQARPEDYQKIVADLENRSKTS
jgi:tRNA A-37 threonylcarbamoyl transferase component Bud32/tetratricopeptide (TPR) repeat protein